jgi:hypothetical protein
VVESPEKSELIDERVDPYAKVDVWVLRNPKISPQCKALYGLLISYGPDRIFPGHVRLARELGVSRQTIINWMADLKKFNLIDWQRTGRSNRYRILGPPKGKEELTSDVKPGIHQMSNGADNRCKEEQTRSRSKELDPPTPDPSNNDGGDSSPSPLEPSTPGAQTLFEKLAAEFKAKGRRAPKRFKSLENKRKFEVAEQKLGQDELSSAIVRALQKGICSVVGVTDFVAKWNGQGNGRKGKYRAPPAKARTTADYEKGDEVL